MERVNWYASLSKKLSLIFLALLIMMAVSSAFPISTIFILFYTGGSLLVLFQSFIVLMDKPASSKIIAEDSNEIEELINLEQ